MYRFKGTQIKVIDLIGNLDLRGINTLNTGKVVDSSRVVVHLVAQRINLACTMLTLDVHLYLKLK